jgi:hypothetical protein
MTLLGSPSLPPRGSGLMPNQPLPLVPNGLHRVLQLSSHLFVLSILVFYLASYYAFAKKLEWLIYFLSGEATSSTNGVAFETRCGEGKEDGHPGGFADSFSTQRVRHLGMSILPHMNSLCAGRSHWHFPAIWLLFALL